MGQGANFIKRAGGSPLRQLPGIWYNIAGISGKAKYRGKRKTMLATAKRMLANGKLMLKDIAECSGLSLAQVKKLQAEMA